MLIKKRLNAIILCVGLLNSGLFSHNVIKGKVLDGDTNDPLPGANVLINGTNYGTATDAFGNFVLKTDSSDVVVKVSYLGYETKEIRITEPLNELMILLKPQPLKFEEISVQSSFINDVHIISDVDLHLRPFKSSQEVLRIMPGLFVAQHAGGGKAEQLFLRGFDVDHGTDVNISVDGIPVNMVSHAHGQGYADLHFIVPEIIENADFGKGPYYTEHGNFTTGGYINFKTKTSLDNNKVGLEVDQYRTVRLLAMANILGQNSNLFKQRAYIVTNYMQTEGYFDSSQNFNRLNLFGKYSNYISDNRLLELQLSTFTSKWNASGQIPERAVESGLIGRFGAIDDTEGGFTGRTNFSANLLTLLENGSSIRSNLYFSKYDFELYSNFTFFLEDTENGDQIRQKEDRRIFGYQLQYDNDIQQENTEISNTYGIGFRYDDVNDNELSHTVNRKTTLDTISFGDVDESNIYAFFNKTYNIDKFTFMGGARVDYFNFEYVNKLKTEYKTLYKNRFAISPKINIFYNLNDKIQLFAKMGVGFHTNDSRVVLEEDIDEILPLAYGSDIGFIYKPIDRLILNTTFWGLLLNQEFVYVGDAGVVEPSGKSQRIGVDVSLRYQLTDWLFADADVNWAQPRLVEEPDGENYIPLAPTLTSTGGLTFKLPNNIDGGLRYRYIDDRPANEDNSVVADGYFVVDGLISIILNNFDIGLAIENIFNTEWKETQFDTETRLFDEEQSVSEIHFIPGTPFCAKVKISYLF